MRIVQLLALSIAFTLPGCTPGQLQTTAVAVGSIASTAIDVYREVKGERFDGNQVIDAANAVKDHVASGGDLDQETIFALVGTNPEAKLAAVTAYRAYVAERDALILPPDAAAKRELITKHANLVIDTVRRGENTGTVQLFTIEHNPESP